MARQWFTTMFSSEPDSTDVVKSGPLNITKVTALVTPIVTAAFAALQQLLPDEDQPLRGLTPGQRLIIVLFVFSFVALVILTDMIVRAYATGKSLEADSKAQVATFTTGILATLSQAGADPKCFVVALRSETSIEPDGQYLVAVLDADKKVKSTQWVATSSVRFE